MLTPAANIHRSRLPALGAIVTVQLTAAPVNFRWRRFIVESFPLCDSADSRYSWGIHTVNLRALDNGEARRVSGHWCVEEGR